MKKSLISLLVVLWVSVAATAPAAADPTFSPGLVRWQRVDMTASKLLVSMEAVIEQAALDLPSVQARLVTPMSPPESREVGYPLALAFVTDGLGRRNEVELLIDGSDGGAIQRTALRRGGSPKYRIYRFEDERILRLTRRPDAGEEDSPPASWTRLSEESHAYPSPGSRPLVTEASALIYLAAASDLSHPGDRVDILALASGEFHRVSLVAREPVETRVDYRIIRGEGSSREKGRTRATRIAILARPLHGDNGDEFELLGLRDLELLVDPVSRVPLELKGKVDFFGRVRFRLDRVTMATDTPSPASD